MNGEAPISTSAWVNEWHAGIDRLIITKVGTALTESRFPVIKIIIMFFDYCVGFAACIPHAEIPEICRWVVVGPRMAAAKFRCCKAKLRAMFDFAIRAQKALHPELF